MCVGEGVGDAYSGELIAERWFVAEELFELVKLSEVPIDKPLFKVVR